MPVNLERLKVSLTKHGAHKIAFVIENFDKEEILENLHGNFRDITIDPSQARNILSVNRSGDVPELWGQIKNYGRQDIFDLVFIANIFSHYKLVLTMIHAIKNKCIVNRGDVIDGKAFTNFAHTIEQFGYSIDHTSDYISFDISRIYHKYYLIPFIRQVLKLKLTDAGWDKTNSIVEESITLDLHEVFGLSTQEFEAWLNETLEISDSNLKKVKAIRNFKSGLKFSSGHNSKFEGDVNVKSSIKHTSSLVHNQIQNKVYKLLVEKYPDDEIGTEIPTNSGSIDIVRKNSKQYFFYEIKTSNNIKTNIRQALSQLLEYAYWNNIMNVEKIVIIAPSMMNNESKAYLDLLRNRFNIPIYYQRYSREHNQLSAEE